MSEYQYFGFRAVDRPVSEENLAFMRQQSTRADITPWSFDNEYHYGDFRGDAHEMLRRGYDVHLHYANFGVRTLMIRLPHGFPDAAAAKPYLLKDSLRFLKDKQGPGGTLVLEPYIELDDSDDLWNLASLLDRLAPLWNEIQDGDLRPLYLAHLAVASDDNHEPEETHEAPVPAGLSQLTKAQSALTELYDLSDVLIAAAAKVSPPLPSGSDSQSQQVQWLEAQPEERKNAWLAQLLADPNSAVRGEILAEFRQGTGAATWPTAPAHRTIAQLQEAAEEIQQEKKRKAAAQAARKREKLLADMKADPAKYLRETEQLVTQRSGDSYRKIAKTLADLRQALAGTNQASLAEQQAQKLKKENPTLRLLVSELRRQGFLPK
jgi:hypothetical protein